MEDQALTRLVQEALAGGLTVRELAARSIDPETGYSPSKTLIGDIKLGAPIKLRRELVRALAAGMGRPQHEVAQAAAEQYAGFDISQVTGIAKQPEATVTVVRRRGSTPSDESIRRHVERIEREEFGP